MTQNTVFVILLILWMFVWQPLSQGQSLRDGNLFDQGRSMTEKSPRAPEDLDKMKDVLGQWDVSVTTYPTDSTSFSATGLAEITYMNRGYAYMNRMHIPDYDEAGHEASVIQFLNYDPLNATWVLGEASSYTESVAMYNGDFKGKKLVLSTGVRQNGSSLVSWHEMELAFKSADKFSVSLKTSTNGGEDWRPVSKQVFTRRDVSPDFMMTQEGIGEASPDRPKQTAQFDFLLGEWNASHNILFNGQWIQFPTTATAVHVLNGHAILEHSWFDLDPSLPDAATSIIRIYNRSMRRWESLFLNNRGNSQLFFGGQKEDDEIVLHNFESNSVSTIPRYVFHNIAADNYAWYAESSSDRGKTFNKTWEISFARK